MREPLAEEPASGPGFLLPFGHRHSLPGSSCARWGIPLPSRLAYRRLSRRTPSGLSRSACDRYGRGGRPLNPGDGGALPAGQVRPAGTCRLPTAGPCSPASCNPPARVLMTRRHRGFTHVHPSGLPQPVAPGWNRSPWAFPRASHPAVTRDARQGRDGPLRTGPGITPLTSINPPSTNTAIYMRLRVARSGSARTRGRGCGSRRRWGARRASGRWTPGRGGPSRCPR